MIIAGKPGVAKIARMKLLADLPQLKIVDAYDGYFNENTEDEVIKQINEAKPHVLFVGMGTPAQEKWIANHRNEINTRVCWSVGALFDYIAGIEAPVPKWMDKLSLEWLWRLLIDPINKWKRYILGIPIFLFHVFRQKFLTTK